MEAGRVKSDNTKTAHQNKMSLLGHLKEREITWSLRVEVALRHRQSSSPLWKETWVSQAVSSETGVSGRKEKGNNLLS